MAKTIELKYKDEKYTLEYTRKTVEQMVGRGLTREELTNNPFAVTELFYGAFREHHPYVNRKVTDAIYEGIKGKDALLQILLEMYTEPLNALFAEPEEDEGNATWEVSD